MKSKHPPEKWFSDRDVRCCVKRKRRAQGLRPNIDDPVALANVAKMIRVFVDYPGTGGPSPRDITLSDGLPMSFEVLLIGSDDAKQLPRKTDLLRVFNGHVIRDDPPISRSALSVLPDYEAREGYDEPLPVTRLLVGNPDDGDCTVSYASGPDGNPIQSLITIREPLRARWLWVAVHELMTGFDLFMVIPGAPDTYAIVARPDATVPVDHADSMPIVQVRSVDDLMAALDSPPALA
jgi:hypothetical protein